MMFKDNLSSSAESSEELSVQMSVVGCLVRESDCLSEKSPEMDFCP